MYFGLIYEDMKIIRNVAGCLKPCNYLEYKFHGEPMPSTFDSSGDSIIYRVVFLTGPPYFQYQNEKQVAANQD